MPLGILEYRVINLMNQLIWEAQIKEYKDTMQRDHFEAIETYKKFSEKPAQLYHVILDIAERVSPDLFGIEKVTGCLGNGDYVMYQMKKKYANQYKIRTIVDTDCNDMVLVETEETYIISSVEVFSNRYRKIVVLNSIVKNGNISPTRRDMFKKIINGQGYYRRVVGVTKRSIYSTLEINFPVRINLFLDQRETSVYESKETINETEKFTIFNIKESDGRGMKYVFKFVFGDILERRKYKIGNMPEEPCRKVYDVLKKNVFQTEVIVARSGSGPNPEMTDYNVFNIL
ncbi:hypothetical protein MACK_002037 [Theileria orientalis]|uniref:Uncharacterized protein n=1 Tax=Theileria orientalis TaxID=68886 RepID=A0A976QTZ0_THEOR|nr:hypothetical protein MACK_002037 [Theileria orientalis]